MEFPRQEPWSGFPFPSPRDLPDPRNKPTSPALQADSLPPEPPGKPLMWVGLTQSTEDLSRTNSSYLTAEMEYWSFPTFRLK